MVGNFTRYNMMFIMKVTLPHIEQLDDNIDRS